MLENQWLYTCLILYQLSSLGMQALLILTSEVCF
ncbi:hypothetical protein NSTC745_03332 [Nostoc sp. DSM 114161]|jgi:hypothetical protein